MDKDTQEESLSSQELRKMLHGWLQVTKKAASRKKTNNKLARARKQCSEALEAIGPIWGYECGSYEKLEKAQDAIKKIATVCGYPNHWSEMRAIIPLISPGMKYDLEPHPWYKGIKQIKRIGQGRLDNKIKYIKIKS